MASLDLLHSLLESRDAWEAAQTEVKDATIDLRLAKLAGTDLKGRRFERCDLSGVDFNGCNLDDTSFISCKITMASFANTSMIKCNMTDVRGSGCVFKHAIVRSSSFTDASFIESNFDFIKIDDVIFNKCMLSGQAEAFIMVKSKFIDGSIRRSSFVSSEYIECEMINCAIDGVMFADTKINNVRFSSCDICGTEYQSSRLNDVVFYGCRLFDVKILNTFVASIDLTRSTLRRLNVGDFGPGATMTEVVIRDCAWPRQKGHVSIFGKYYASPHLLKHPVQDIRGVAPILRREIADAQYLYEMHERCAGAFSRIMLRMWGFTCAFGTSLTRLMAVTVVCIFILVGAVGIVDETYPCLISNFEYAYSEFTYVVSTTFNMNDDKGNALSPGREAITPFARILGFVVLGLWTGLAANRLGKLSSE